MTAVPSLAAEARLDLIRGEVMIGLAELELHTQIAAAYLQHGRDDRLEAAIADACEAMRTVASRSRKLLTAIADAGLTAEAAKDWHASKDRAA